MRRGRRESECACPLWVGITDSVFIGSCASAAAQGSGHSEVASVLCIGAPLQDRGVLGVRFPDLW